MTEAASFFYEAAFVIVMLYARQVRRYSCYIFLQPAVTISDLDNCK